MAADGQHEDDPRVLGHHPRGQQGQGAGGAGVEGTERSQGIRVLYVSVEVEDLRKDWLAEENPKVT